MAIFGLLCYSPIHGAYTELFAGLSPDVTLAKNGAWSKSTFYTLQADAD
jgi:retinol dehydrogenase-12